MRITAVVWQSYFNCLSRAARQIKEFEVRVYPARKVEKDEELLSSLLKEARECEIFFAYRGSEGFWERIDQEIRQGRFRGKVVYLGHDPQVQRLSNVKAEVLSTAYQYVTRGGVENAKNLFRFLVSELYGVDISFDPPLEIPWEGIYHPRAPRVFFDPEEYLAWYGPKPVPTVGILFSRHYWVNKNLELEDLLIETLEAKGFNVIATFTYSVRDQVLGAKGGADVIREWFLDREGRPRVDALVKLTSFLFGTAGKDAKNGSVPEEGVALLKKLGVVVFSPLSSYWKTVEEWEKGELDLDIGWAVALPEFEGVIEPILVAAQAEEGEERKKVPVRERVEKLVERVRRWLELKRIPPEERKVAFVLHNNPCASVEATVGSASHLDSLESVVEVLRKMKERGYRVEVPVNGKALIDEIMTRKAISEFRWTTVEEIVSKGGALALLPVERYLQWFSELPEGTRARMIDAWGEPPGQEKDGVPPAMVYQGKIVVTGIRLGNAVVCVQPKRGCAGSRCDGRVCKILHDPDVPPPHQYIATYKWLSRGFGAHVIVHVGTHGNLEFLPGKGVGLSSSCFPDIAIDTVPHLYIYNADNPAEGTVAKRRSYAVLVDHMQTAMTQSGLYGELEVLEKLLEEYWSAKAKDPTRLHILQHRILDALRASKVDRAIKVTMGGKRVALSELSDEGLHELPFEEVVEAIHLHLSLIRNTQIQDGMHIFGRLPQGERRVEFIYSVLRYDHGRGASFRREVARLLGYDLEALLSSPQRIDPKTGKSYGAILEQVDKVGKEIVKEVLRDAGVA